MMKKKNQMLVSLSLVTLLGGCSEEKVQRDVYNSLDDCRADWQKAELCEEEQSSGVTTSSSSYSSSSHSSSGTHYVGDSHSSYHHAASGTVAGAAAGYMMAKGTRNFMGPAYHPSNRAVATHTGEIVRPLSNHSVGKPVLVKGNAGKMNSKPISRNGFSSGYSSRSFGG